MLLEETEKTNKERTGSSTSDTSVKELKKSEIEIIEEKRRMLPAPPALDMEKVNSPMLSNSGNHTTNFGFDENKYSSSSSSSSS